MPKLLKCTVYTSEKKQLHVHRDTQIATKDGTKFKESLQTIGIKPATKWRFDLGSQIFVHQVDTKTINQKCAKKKTQNKPLYQQHQRDVPAAPVAPVGPATGTQGSL